MPETRQRRKRKRKAGGKKAMAGGGHGARRDQKPKASGGPNQGTMVEGPAGVPNQLGPRQWAGLMQGPLVKWPDIEIRIGSQGDNRAPSGAVGIAILLAESDGRTDAEGDGGDSWGGWQINLPSHPAVTKQCATQALCSTRAALRISGGGRDYSPWSAFKNGAYKDRMQEALDAWNNPDTKFVLSEWTSDYGGPFVDNQNPLDAGIAVLGALIQSATWVRTAFVLGGVLMVYIGIKRMMK